MSRALAAGSSSVSVMSGSIRTPPMVMIGSVVSATVTTSNGVPVKRPVRNSASRCPTSQSASESYRATWIVCVFVIDSILS